MKGLAAAWRAGMGMWERWSGRWGIWTAAPAAGTVTGEGTVASAAATGKGGGSGIGIVVDGCGMVG